MPAECGRRFLLLYGSQTGQSQAIAEEIADVAGSKGYNVDLHCFSDTDKKFCVENEPCVVMVTSSTGDGEAPDTVRKFWRRIKKSSLQSDFLSIVNYALLGLADSNYNSFGRYPNDLNKRLLAVGATPFYPFTLADDAVGLEVTVDPWMAGLWPALEAFFNADSSDKVSKESETGNHSVKCDITQNGIGDNETHITTKHTESSGGLNGNSDNGELDSINGDVHSNGESFHNNLGNNSLNDQNQGIPQGKDISGYPNGESSSLVQSESPDDGIFSVTGSNEVLPNGTQSFDVLNATSEGVISASRLKTEINGTNEIEASTRLETGQRTWTNGISDSNNKTSDEISKHLDINSEKISVSNKIEETQLSHTNDIDQLSSDVRILSLDENIFFCQTVPLIGRSPTPLHGQILTTPKVLCPYLHIEYAVDNEMDASTLPHQNGSKFPFASSAVFGASLISCRKLTRADAVKTTLEIELDLKGCPFTYAPGDAFSVIGQNEANEVNVLLKRLGVHELADVHYQLTVLPDTKKKNPALPVHIPPSATLRHLFSTCLDIREPPKKATVRMLADHTSNPVQQQWLLELCSLEGADLYAQTIRAPGVSLLDVLQSCPTCVPPVTRLVERLSRLHPRPYSASSSNLATPDKLRFTFNVVDIPEGQGRLYSRHGVCSGWLMRAAESCQLLTCQPQIPIFARTKTFFHLPDDERSPLLLIGPGVGVAPFIGFLKQRHYLSETERKTLGEAWLFFGCRHEERDYIYRDALESYVESGALSHLCTSFSRDSRSPEEPRYVQDSLRRHGDDVVRLIEAGARTYVCGEAKGMARGVCDTVIDIFVKLKGLSQEEGEAMMQTLRHERRYLEDVW